MFTEDDEFRVKVKLTMRQVCVRLHEAGDEVEEGTISVAMAGDQMAKAIDELRDLHNELAKYVSRQESAE